MGVRKKSLARKIKNNIFQKQFSKGIFLDFAKPIDAVISIVNCCQHSLDASEWNGYSKNTKMNNLDGCYCFWNPEVNRLELFGFHGPTTHQIRARNAPVNLMPNQPPEFRVPTRKYKTKYISKYILRKLSFPYRRVPPHGPRYQNTFSLLKMKKFVVVILQQ